jgi:hypothetical protein
MMQALDILQVNYRLCLASNCVSITATNKSPVPNNLGALII